MHATVKALTHWAIYKGYRMRFTARSPRSVTGILVTPEGELSFDYDPTTRTIRLAQQQIAINDYGWELHTETVPYHE